MEWEVDVDRMCACESMLSEYRKFSCPVMGPLHFPDTIQIRTPTYLIQAMQCKHGDYGMWVWVVCACAGGGGGIFSLYIVK